jgi:hypothetical protein
LQALLQPQTGAVEQFGGQTVRGRQETYQFAGFLFGQDDGQALGLFSPDGIDGALQLLFEHLPVEKDQGAEGLVLGGGSVL